MAFPNQERPQSFDYIDDPDLRGALEQEAIERLGLKAYLELVAKIRTEIMNANNAGDMSPDYDPEAEKWEHDKTARRITLGTLFTVGAGIGLSAAGIVVAHSIKRKHQPDNQPDTDD